MKSKVMMLAVLLAVVLAVNFSYAQEQKDCCSKPKTEVVKDCCSKSQTECTTKTGTSMGAQDTAQYCPVSGEILDGAEGAPVKYTYLGKEYTFCCGGCVKKFKAEPMKYIKGEIKCPVMGDAADKNVSTVVDGVKYYFCCEKCISKFEKDPSKYLNKTN